MRGETATRKRATAEHADRDPESLKKGRRMKPGSSIRDAILWWTAHSDNAMRSFVRAKTMEDKIRNACFTLYASGRRDGLKQALEIIAWEGDDG